MIRSAVTISLVPEARGGPFVFWDDLGEGCRKAAALGFDGVEVFAPSAAALSPSHLRQLLDAHGIALAAMGTGGGWVLHKLTLTSPDADERRRARDFIRSIIDFAGPFGAPAIVGSMQGRWGAGGVDQQTARGYLSDSLNDLGDHARQYRVPLLYEPLNRYETNLVNTLSTGVQLVSHLAGSNVKLLADLFHMNIEETNIALALWQHREHVGHVHFADSTRLPPGLGHTNFRPIADALLGSRYHGYVSAEALPLPDPDLAALMTIRAFKHYFDAPRAA